MRSDRPHTDLGQTDDEVMITESHSESSTRSRPRPGSVLCLFGLDGSGKTTISKRLVESLKREGFEAVYAHPKLGMRPWTSECVDAAAPIGEINGRWERGRLGRSGIRLLAYVLLAENWLTIQMKVRRQIAKGKVVVVERYWPDSFVDLVVDFGLSFEKAQKMVGLLQVSAPSEYFLLDVPVDVALTRKPGPYTSEYLSRRNALYQRLTKAIGATRIDTQEALEPTVNKMLHHAFQGKEDSSCQQS